MRKPTLRLMRIPRQTRLDVVHDQPPSLKAGKDPRECKVPRAQKDPLDHPETQVYRETTVLLDPKENGATLVLLE